MLRVAVTGHRPQYLIGGYDLLHPSNIELKSELTRTLFELAKEQSTVLALTGMALGVDTLFAESVLDLKEGDPDKYLLECAIPHRNQDKMWKPKDKDWYNTILSFADKKTLVTDSDYKPYLLQKRNEYLVDNCDVLIAVWNGNSKSGTYNAVRYAKKHNKEIIYINTGLK